MTTKYITTYISGGYNLSPVYSTLSITSTGGVGGSIVASQRATIINDGRIVGNRAIYLEGGGEVINGSETDTSAYIFGGITGAKVVENFAIMDSSFTVFKLLVNGSLGDQSAKIDGDVGFIHAKLENFGTITGLIGGDGGVMLNGAASDTNATINGSVRFYEAEESNRSTTLKNYGAITGATSGNYRGGVDLGNTVQNGGRLVNGSRHDTTALISGATYGVLMNNGDTATNYGTISGSTSADGILIVLGSEGDRVINGGGSDSSALIEGVVGIYETGDNVGGFNVSNFGTISGASSAGGVGAACSYGAYLINGSATNHSALIEGYFGISGASAVTNFGTIAALGSSSGCGISLSGIYGTVTNYGVIKGGGGGSVVFKYSTDVLVVGANGVFEGAVIGAGGTLDLDGGDGTLVGLPGAGTITVLDDNGPANTFNGFGTLQIGSAADFTLSGSGSIATRQAVVDDGFLSLQGTVKNAGYMTSGAGTLTLSGEVVNTGHIESNGVGTIIMSGPVTKLGTIAADGGTISVLGDVSGTGIATIDGGTLDFASIRKQNVTFAGTTGELELGRARDYTGTVIGFSLTGQTSLDLDDIGFVSADEATYTDGVLTVTDGMHTANIHLAGDYDGETFVASSDQHGGVKIVDQTDVPAVALTPPARLQFIAAMAGLGNASAVATRHSGSYTNHMSMLIGPRTAIT